VPDDGPAVRLPRSDRDDDADRPCLRAPRTILDFVLHLRPVGEVRHQLWTIDWLIGEVERRGRTAGERLLSVFDAFDEWFRRPDYEGCLFTSSLTTMMRVYEPT
jgi:hypothetical protein